MTLLVHDGELSDVRALLESIGAPFTERLADLSEEDREVRWEVVIASAKRILEVDLDPWSVRATYIAILAHDSRTLRNTLRRAGIQMMVRRPVHPATLRALIVHALYRGPEKRDSARVNVGAPVQLRVGWRQRPAILMDLSVGGCRLVTKGYIARGREIRVQIPSAIPGGAVLSLRARVLSCAADPDRKAGCLITTARFERVGPRQNKQLSAVVEEHKEGPATYADGASQPAPAARTVEPAAPARPRSVPPEPAASESAAPEPLHLVAPPSPEPAAPAPLHLVEAPSPEPVAPAPLHLVAPPSPEPVAPIADPIELRKTDRHRLGRRVISLGEEAARVLMGRDISVGGMRVGPNSSLAVGMVLQLAVHAVHRPTPLVLRAEVHRDDGERGLVLRFRGLSVEAIRYLIEVMDELPLIDIERGGRGCLVTEILAAEAGGAA